MAARANQLKGTRARTVTIFESNGKNHPDWPQPLRIYPLPIVIDAGLVIC